MISVLFASLASFIDEVSSSIIKFETVHKKETVYTAGFINTLFGILVFLAIAAFRNSFVFSLASLPTFAIKAVLEIFQAQASMLAIMKTDRSTYAFVRNITIPLLLATDLLLGFTVSSGQWIGITLIFATFFFIILFHILNTKGIGYSLFTAMNAVATISLFKYNITHFNSVEAEQIITLLILLFYFFLAARFLARENPLSFLRRRTFLGQGFAHSIASIFGSFAIAFGNPGIATAAGRASSVLAGIISGHNYFQEKKFGAKIIVSAALIAGLALLTR